MGTVTNIDEKRLENNPSDMVFACLECNSQNWLIIADGTIECAECGSVTENPFCDPTDI